MGATEIAITAINETAKTEEWDTETQIIVACEFISHLNKDSEFKDFLENKSQIVQSPQEIVFSLL